MESPEHRKPRKNPCEVVDTADFLENIRFVIRGQVREIARHCGEEGLGCNGWAGSGNHLEDCFI